MNYSGIDLHSNNSVVTVIDETDRAVAEKRLPNDVTKILAFLAPRGGDTNVRSALRFKAGQPWSGPLDFKQLTCASPNSSACAHSFAIAGDAA